MDRCPRCDSRYCWAGCHAWDPGYVYAVYHGWITFPEAANIEADWEATGIEYGIHHGLNRVEWDQATPADDDTIDAIRITALTRETTRNHASLYG